MLAMVACHSGTPTSGPELERGAGRVETERPLPSADAAVGGAALDATTPRASDKPFPTFGGERTVQVRDLPTRYTKDIQGEGPLYALLETSAGTIRCRLYEDRAPATVDNFVGLARGMKSWRRADTGVIVKEPLYDGVVFHRRVPGLLIQTGDPTGTGMGNPGFAIPDEFGEGLSHNQVGVMSMAQSHPDGSGSQFFITDGPALQFDGRYPIFGLCGDHEVIHAIAASQAAPNGSDEQVVLRHVRFER